MADLAAALRPHVDSGEIPGLVALVARGDEVEVVVLGAGMRRDSIVRAASITKPLTAALTMTLVATVIVMLVAVVLGVAMGRGRRTDTAIRPFLDGFQTIPAFVYLVPVVLFFGIGVGGAVVSTLVYAVPPVIR